MKNMITSVRIAMLVMISATILSCGISEERVQGRWQIIKVSKELHEEFDIEDYDYFMEFSEGSDFEFCQIEKESEIENCLKGKWSLKEALITCKMKPATEGFILHIDEISKKTIKGRISLAGQDMTSHEEKIKLKRLE